MIRDLVPALALAHKRSASRTITTLADLDRRCNKELLPLNFRILIAMPAIVESPEVELSSRGNPGDPERGQVAAARADVTPSQRSGRRSWWPGGLPSLSSQAFPEREKENRYRIASWTMNLPLYLSFALANAAHTVYIIALLFGQPGSQPSPLQYALVFAITLPSSIGIIGLTVSRHRQKKVTGILYNAVLAVVSVMIASITSMRNLLCYYGAEPAGSCAASARPNTINLPIYSNLGLLLVLIVAHADRIAMFVPFTLLLVLLTWNAALVEHNSVPAWFGVVFYIGAFLFGLLVSTYAERNERVLFDANEQLREEVRDRKAAEDRAAVAERNTSKFYNYIWHELRVPLNVVVQSEGLLQSDDEFQKVASADILENFARIHSGLNSIQVILNDVLDIKRFSEGRYLISLQPLDIHELARETLWSFEPSWKEKALLFAMDVDERIDRLPYKLLSDPIRLKQVIWNLTSNAIKFTRRDGHITFRTRIVGQGGGALSPGGKVDILTEVEDDGAGISSDDQKKLFSDFVQIEPGRLQGGKGSGLGLAVCKNIINALGGRYGVRSTLGKGSTFWFLLSYEISKELKVTDAGTSRKNAEVGPLTPGLRVLVTDDDQLTRTVMKKLLVKLGHSVDLAVNGRNCLEKLASAPYDLLLIDNMMPVMTGIDAIRNIRGQGNDIPIISLSGGTEDDIQEELRRLGVSEILLKPSNMQTIAGAIRRATSTP
jgi:signal transduction histidine kinase/CheY-like chemotaxis protein